MDLVIRQAMIANISLSYVQEVFHASWSLIFTEKSCGSQVLEYKKGRWVLKGEAARLAAVKFPKMCIEFQ